MIIMLINSTVKKWEIQKKHHGVITYDDLRYHPWGEYIYRLEFPSCQR